MSEDTALQVQQTALEIPQALVAEDVAGKVKGYMERKEKKISFNGKPYPEFDDYQYAATFFGWRVVTESEPVTVGDQSGFKGKAKVVDAHGIEVGAADSYCFSNEPNWRNKPLFQLGSMAQTRAGSKALANLLRPVFKLAGYETTPAEEMAPELQRTVQQPKAKEIPAKVVQSFVPEEDNTDPIEFEPPSEPLKAVHKVFGNPTKPITEKQGKLLYAIYKGKGVSDERMKQAIKSLFNLDHSKDLTNAQLSQLIDLVNNGAIR